MLAALPSSSQNRKSSGSLVLEIARCLMRRTVILIAARLSRFQYAAEIRFHSFCG